MIIDIAESIKKLAYSGLKAEELKKGGWRIISMSCDGFKILTGIGQDGRFQTSYPFFLGG